MTLLFIHDGETRYQLTRLRDTAVTQTAKPEAAIDNIARFVCDFYTHHDYHTFLAQAA